MKKSVQISMAGVITALSIVLLYFGGTIWIFAYIMPVFTGMLGIIIVQSINRKTAFIIYVCVSILSLILLSDKECALTYIFFFGYYPIIIDSIKKIKNKVFNVIFRFFIFNTAIISSQLVCIYVFLIPIDDFPGKYGIIILILLANILFILYEKLLDAANLIYVKKYRKRINSILKK